MALNYTNKNTFIYPSGSTVSRPTSVNNGFIYFNTTIGALQIYENGYWYVLTNINSPSAPSSVVATDQGSGRAYNNGQASVAFTSATETSGFPASYTVTSSPGSYTASGSSSPLTITGLQSSTQYTYTVTATNNTGTSSASSASSGVTATTVPQAPTIGTATGADSSATLTFTAGATGGSAITNYKYSTDNSTYTAFSPAQTSSPLTISNLTNGTSYSFYLKAVNANGDSSASSASNSVTPAVATSYESIATVTVGSGGASNVEFTSIPSTYTHLQVRAFNFNSGTGNVWDDSIDISINSDTTNANYDYHLLRGNGTSAASLAYASGTGVSRRRVFYAGGGYQSGTYYPGAHILDILDYANTNKYKTLRALSGVDINGSGYVTLSSTLWQNTNAITSLSFTTESGENFAQYSSFALYGIKGA